MPLARTAPLPVPIAPRSAADRADRVNPRLDWLRKMAARCRCSARADLFRACALLSRDPDAAAEAYATALFRALPTVDMRGKISLFEPGCTDRSFDETWLISALDAARREDTASMTFLLARRVPAHARRQIGFLLINLSRHLDKRDQAPRLGDASPSCQPIHSL